MNEFMHVCFAAASWLWIVIAAIVLVATTITLVFLFKKRSTKRRSKDNINNDIKIQEVIKCAL
jgi:bacteriorhodopsin